MIKLIVNADDFGLGPGVNHGIIDGYKYGIVNSTSMMMNMDWIEHAVQLAKEHPNLRVGIHLVLTCGRPLTKNASTLVNEHGSFKSLSELGSKAKVSLTEIEHEWSAQIERFLETGLKPSHLDSHHHIHTLKELQPVVKHLSKKFALPVRRNGIIPIDGVESTADISLFDFYSDGVKEDYFEKLSSRFEDGITAEIMCHPAYLDNILLNMSSYTFKRLTELEILTSTKLPENIILL